MRQECVASKVEGWVGGTKIVFELYVLVAVYKYIHIISDCYIIFTCCRHENEHSGNGLLQKKNQTGSEERVKDKLL